MDGRRDGRRQHLAAHHRQRRRRRVGGGGSKVRRLGNDGFLEAGTAPLTQHRNPLAGHSVLHLRRAGFTLGNKQARHGHNRTAQITLVQNSDTVRLRYQKMQKTLQGSGTSTTVTRTPNWTGTLTKMTTGTANNKTHLAAGREILLSDGCMSVDHTGPIGFVVGYIFGGCAIVPEVNGLRQRFSLYGHGEIRTGCLNVRQLSKQANRQG